MSCNLDFSVKRETVSWLTDVITLEDIEYDTYDNHTEDTLDSEAGHIHGDRYKINYWLLSKGNF